MEDGVDFEKSDIAALHSENGSVGRIAEET
jgi:hypothetical protein